MTAEREEIMSREDAIALGATKWWEGLDPVRIVGFQLFADKLCMPFDIYHEATEKVLGMTKSHMNTTAFAAPERVIAAPARCWCHRNTKQNRRADDGTGFAVVSVMDTNRKPTARTCELCGKPKGVTRFLGHWLHVFCARTAKGRAIWGKR